ncbi:hypothetical protein EVA_08779 [gut metagenome]|uniref:Uncharacterized protein n=1 Tax=gut metagenome TaxID=749906 RepID=J9G8E2_9ZZZZ
MGCPRLCFFAFHYFVSSYLLAQLNIDRRTAGFPPPTEKRCL